MKSFILKLQTISFFATALILSTIVHPTSATVTQRFIGTALKQTKTSLDKVVAWIPAYLLNSKASYGEVVKEFNSYYAEIKTNVVEPISTFITRNNIETEDKRLFDQVKRLIDNIDKILLATRAKLNSLSGCTSQLTFFSTFNKMKNEIGVEFSKLVAMVNQMEEKSRDALYAQEMRELQATTKAFTIAADKLNFGVMKERIAQFVRK